MDIESTESKDTHLGPLPLEPESASGRRPACRKSTPVALLLGLCLFTSLLLLFSTAVFDSEWQGVKRGRLTTSTRVFAVGLPRWLKLHVMGVKDLQTLKPSPTKVEYRFEIDYGRLRNAVVCSSLIGFMLSLPLVSWIRRAKTIHLIALATGLLLALIASVVYGAMTLVEAGKELPDSIMFLAVGIPTLLLLTAMFHKSFLTATYVSLAAVIFPWWGIRVGWFFRPPTKAIRPPRLEIDDLLNVVCMCGLMVVATCLSVAVFRLLNYRRRRS